MCCATLEDFAGRAQSLDFTLEDNNYFMHKHLEVVIRRGHIDAVKTTACPIVSY